MLKTIIWCRLQVLWSEVVLKKKAYHAQGRFESQAALAALQLTQAYFVRFSVGLTRSCCMWL